MSPLTNRHPTYRKTPESLDGRVILFGLPGHRERNVPVTEINAGITISRILEWTPVSGGTFISLFFSLNIIQG